MKSIFSHSMDGAAPASGFHLPFQWVIGTSLVFRIRVWFVTLACAWVALEDWEVSRRMEAHLWSIEAWLSVFCSCNPDPS